MAFCSRSPNHEPVDQRTGFHRAHLVRFDTPDILRSMQSSDASGTGVSRYPRNTEAIYSWRFLLFALGLPSGGRNSIRLDGTGLDSHYELNGLRSLGWTGESKPA